MNVTEQGKAMKALEDMNLIDDFLFGEVMADEECGLEACRIILSCVLKREVRNITFTAQKSVPGVSETSHGIRMDVYVTEEPDQTGESIRVYDVEPDKLSDRRESLPRRSRYYGGLIDTQLLNTGIDYEKLPDLVSIFILSYDPFGENALYYEAGTVVKTHPNVEYDDGVKRIFLYVKGKLPDIQDIPAVALVGTRNPSEYGLKMAERIGSQLAEEGALIVSGLSSGIESAGARSALSAGGTVIAVLGTEIAKAPRDYSEKICKKGALVSEYAPGTKTQKSFFRARNRIGSGLSAGVVAIEAPLGSGTLLYVAEAIEQGRDIFAVPGNADSPKSEGTNELIKNGAKAVTCGNDIMEEYRIRYKGRLKALPANTDKTPDLSPALKHGDKSVDKKEERGYIDLSDYLKSLSVNQLEIISAIESPGTGVDDIIERSGLPAASVLSDLTILQIKGFVIQESGKRFTLNFKK